MNLLVLFALIQISSVNSISVGFIQDGNSITCNLTGDGYGQNFQVLANYFDNPSGQETYFLSNTKTITYPGIKQVCVTVSNVQTCSWVNTATCSYKDGVYNFMCVANTIVNLSNTLIVLIITLTVYLCYKMVIGLIVRLCLFLYNCKKQGLITALTKILKSGLQIDTATDGMMTFRVNNNVQDHISQDAQAPVKDAIAPPDAV